MSLQPLAEMIPGFSSLGAEKDKQPKNKNPIRLMNCRKCGYLIPSNKDNPMCVMCQAHKMLNTEALSNNNLKPASIESDNSLLASIGGSKRGGKKNKKNKKKRKPKKTKRSRKKKKRKSKKIRKKKRNRTKKRRK